MSYELQPGGSYRPPAAPSSVEPQYCTYCGAPLSEFYYFCLACATPYKNVDAVLTPSRPRQLTGEELVALKAPHVKTLFFTYLGVIVGVGILAELLFREERPDLKLMLQDFGIMVPTAVFGWMYRRSLVVQFKRFGFNHWAAFVGLAALVPTLLLDYGYHWLFIKGLNLEDGDFLSELRGKVSETALVITFCVTPALSEEIAFRGLMQHWLQAAIAPWKALVVASFLFAIMHLSVISFPYLLLVGVLLGWMKQKTGSLYPSMLAHFLHNWVVIEYFHYG